MPSLSLNGRLIYFAHCPKAGGTSVERFMVERWGPAVGHLGWGWDRRWARRGERPGEIPCSPQHLVWEDAQRVLPRAPDHVFALVRDPVARMVSEFEYQRAGRLTGPFGRPLRHLGFSAWLRVMFAMADRNPYTHDNHFRPQVAFLPQGDVTLFRLEDGIAPVLDWLCATLGEPPPQDAPHVLKSAAARAVPSEADRALIARRFAADYRRFGYALPVAGRTFAAGRGFGAPAGIAAALLDPLYRRGLV